MTAVAPLSERACHVVLADVFDGPLDLLLQLVRERELDIATVPLASVAEQFFAYVSAMEDLDVEVAADYLVVASTLVFLKSRSLLPPIPAEFATEGEDSPEIVEARLRERLIAYSKYRDAGDAMRAFLAQASATYYRDGGDPASELVQRYRIRPDRLRAAFEAALRGAKAEKREIVRDRVSLMDQMTLVYSTVRASGRASFLELCADMTRTAIIVTFLAVLELIRRGRVAYEQSESYADIMLFAMTASEQETVVANA